MTRAILAMLSMSACTDGETDTSDTPTEDSRVHAGPARTCADPDARLSVGPWERTVYAADWWKVGPRYGGKGVTLEDFDGDGALDLFVPQSGGASHLLFGDGQGQFVEREESVLSELSDVAGANASDLDFDGDQDLIVFGFRTAPAILWNDGSGVFTTEFLATKAVGCGGTASLGDMDLDGDLDLLYGRLANEMANPVEACGSVLFENQDGVFVDVSERIPAELFDMKVMSSGWLQLDGDLWPELYLITDRPQTFDGNRRADFDGTSFSVASGTGLEVDMAGMGLGVGDLNDDGIWDLVVPGIDEIVVLVSNPAGVWVNSASAFGVVPNRTLNQSWGWGGEFGDLDNDGDLDITMSFGADVEQGYDAVDLQPDEVWVNDGTNQFTPVAAAWGMDDTLSTRGVRLADVNGDGWLDVVKRELGGVVVTYVSRCGESHWLEIALNGPAGNPRGIGATVEIDVAGQTHRRPIESGSTGYNAYGPPTAHFGLAAHDQADAVRVLWPDGTTTHHPAVAADRLVSITYGVDAD